MKSQLVILLILVSSLLATNADQKCDNLLQQCNQFRTKCTPDITTLYSCCDLTNLPISKAPSGVYAIMSNCSCGQPFIANINVYCDMKTDEGGWMVVQRNTYVNGKFAFESKRWKEYEDGFGDLTGDKFWYGLKALHCFTQTGQWEMRIDFQFFNKTWSYVHYKTFKVGSGTSEYRLILTGFTGITPINPFADQNYQRFTTVDNDNDSHSGRNCARSNGGWWYKKCTRFYVNDHPPVAYFTSRGDNLLFTEIKIRPRGCTI